MSGFSGERLKRQQHEATQRRIIEELTAQHSVNPALSFHEVLNIVRSLKTHDCMIEWSAE